MDALSVFPLCLPAVEYYFIYHVFCSKAVLLPILYFEVAMKQEDLILISPLRMFVSVLGTIDDFYQLY